ncbi:MAG: hypothetical protein Q8L88_15965 [Bacteroidota bacterium]|nr:hypothetical protein [Bacteroidota bacterium]
MSITENRALPSYHTSIVLLVAVFFTPLLLNIVAFQLPFDVVLLNYLFATIFILSSIRIPRQTDNTVIRFFVWICLIYIFMGFINLVRDGYGLLSFLGRHYSIPVALGIIAFFLRTNPTQRKAIELKFVYAMSVLFLVQLVFSIYESFYFSDFIVNSYDWNTANKTLEYFPALELSDRLQIDFFFNQLNIPFQMTFSGMLGQHNHWGTQLPFYFLLFGYTYFATERKNKYFLVLMGFVAVSSLLNTSRFGMIAIFVTGVFFFFILSTYSKNFKRFVGISVLAVLFFYINVIIENIIIYMALTDTFSTRIDTWDILGSIAFDRTILSTLFGSPFKELRLISQKLDWVDYENLGFTLIFERGLPYALLFVSFLGVILKNAGKLKQPEKLMVWLLVTNMILVSLWSNVLFRFTSFGLVAVMLCIAFLPTEEIESEVKTVLQKTL